MGYEKYVLVWHNSPVILTASVEDGGGGVGGGGTTKDTKDTKALLCVALNAAGKRTTEYTEYTEEALRSVALNTETQRLRGEAEILVI